MRDSKTCNAQDLRKNAQWRRGASQIRRSRAPSGLELVTITLLLAFTLRGLDTHLLVVLLQGCEIFARLGEFTFFHPFTNVVVNAGHHLRIAVLFEIMQHARMTLAKSPPGTTV